MTYTFALLEISQTAFDEIANKLTDAGYTHAFSDGGKVIDMHGIGLTPSVSKADEDTEYVCNRCGTLLS